MSKPCTMSGTRRVDRSLKQYLRCICWPCTSPVFPLLALARRQSGAGKSRSTSSAAAPKRESKAFELVRKAIQEDVTTQLVDVMQSFRKKLDAAARKLKKEGKVRRLGGSPPFNVN